LQNGKAVLFGTKGRFGQNFGVLAAWVICGTIGLILTVMYTRKRAIKKQERERRRKEEEQANGKAQ
jgi:Na+/melibiose symporter-like transporter